jgi:hypothetical protein
MTGVATSPEQAEALKQAITGLANRLSDTGFYGSQIGAAMVGIGAILVCNHAGRAWALDVLESAKDAVAPRQS